MENIAIATIKPWNIKNAEKIKEMLRDKYQVFIIKENRELTQEYLEIINPKYIFLPHWSWILPESIYNIYNCIVFHMTDLPYGRGGTPLQNIILNKVSKTKISAIKAQKELDAGAVYLKEELYIGLGSAEEIYNKVSETIFFKMIPYILENDPIPYEQKGEVTSFKRRSAVESNIVNAKLYTIDDIFDFIRMLDADGYPNAYIMIGKFKIIFLEVHKKHDKLTGRFEVIDHETK